MKRLIIATLLVFLFTITGCSKESDPMYGEYIGDKYINEKYEFTMAIPETWEVNENIGSVNGTEEVSEDVEELIIALMYPSSNKNKEDGLTILVLNKEARLEGYAKEVYESGLNNEDLKVQSMAIENINGKEFALVEYKNGFVYLTESNNRIIEFNVVYSNNNKRDEIKRIIESIRFK